MGGLSTILKMPFTGNMNRPMTILTGLVFCCFLCGERTFFLTIYHDHIVSGRGIGIRTFGTVFNIGS
ncbi:hypothetical protein KOEU_35160 [Komagataeibacter europaeus]|uniref:Uncharacterized protein n=1 Tax=Komagataeibacter europaeus TaxID=33995 RepID=A0A0M0ECM9_KOMEU|nr:hypothetical protein GLUCORHAEAF1_14570 [Komagataeibacter rhaeticus AF1]KON62983.1 hypothetical protein KOEU_35160 [Komagataeibacter europaeus]